MPSLDFSILDAICAFLVEYPDILSLSLTCSALRPVAIRHLLRHQPIVLRQAASIGKFYDFIFADPLARLPHTIAIVICISYSDPEADSVRIADCFLALLHHASSSIRSLVIVWTAYDQSVPACIRDLRIIDAVGELTM